MQRVISANNYLACLHVFGLKLPLFTQSDHFTKQNIATFYTKPFLVLKLNKSVYGSLKWHLYENIFTWSFRQKFNIVTFLINFEVISWLNKVCNLLGGLSIPDILSIDSDIPAPSLPSPSQHKGSPCQVSSVGLSLPMSQYFLREGTPKESSWEALGGYYQIDSFSFGINVL